jgi:DNA polymerase-3 subunit epsilon
MNLQLKKPLVFLDIEATGLSLTKDRLVELAVMKLHPDGKQEHKSWRVNPGIPMPEDISKIIGIKDSDLADKPPFKTVAHEILNFIGSADLAGYNPFRLDLPMLMEEFLKAGLEFDISKRKVVDVQKIFFTMEKRNLAAAYEFYCGKSLDDHHSAEADTNATFEVFLAQLGRYQDLGDNIDSVSKAIGNPAENILDLAGRIVKNEKGEEVFNFGKHKGLKVEDVLRKDPAYYGWMMNGDFTEFTKKKLTEIRLRMRR